MRLLAAKPKDAAHGKGEQNMSQDSTTGNDAKTGDGLPIEGLDDLAVTHDHLLGKTVSVMQPKSGFRVGSDAVLLAAAIGVNRGRILDMGAGVGGVSLCLARRLDAVQITAIEIDPVMAALAQRNVVVNIFLMQLTIEASSFNVLRSVLVTLPYRVSLLGVSFSCKSNAISRYCIVFLSFVDKPVILIAILQLFML